MSKYIEEIPSWAIDKYSPGKDHVDLSEVKNIFSVEKDNMMNEICSQMMLNDVDADRWNYNLRRIYCVCQSMANELHELRMKVNEYESKK